MSLFLEKFKRLFEDCLSIHDAKFIAIATQAQNFNDGTDDDLLYAIIDFKDKTEKEYFYKNVCQNKPKNKNILRVDDFQTVRNLLNWNR